MAQMLYDRQSTEVHLNATKRHMRLCHQIKGGEPYSLRIEIFYKGLKEKNRLTEEAKSDKEFAYDIVVLNDGDLDNSVKTLFDKCKQYDRNNVGRPVLNRIFTDGKVSTIVYAPMDKEPDLADQLLARLDALGPDHELSSERAIIQEDISKCRTALKNYHNSIKLQKDAEAVEEIAKSELGRQYEYNYLDMAKEFGKRNANRFFPTIGSSRRNRISDDENGNDNNSGDD